MTYLPTSITREVRAATRTDSPAKLLLAAALWTVALVMWL